MMLLFVIEIFGFDFLKKKALPFKLKSLNMAESSPNITIRKKYKSLRVIKY